MRSIKHFFTLRTPFYALGIAFILLGLILDDSRQLSFGFVWIAIGTVALLFKKKKKVAQENDQG